MGNMEPLGKNGVTLKMILLPIFFEEKYKNQKESFDCSFRYFLLNKEI